MGNQAADRFGDPGRQGRTGISKFCKVLVRYPGCHFLQPGFHLFRSQPGQGAYDVAGRPVRRYELPTRRASQLYPLVAKSELPGRTRSEVDRPHRNLFSQPQRVCHGAAGRNNDLAPQHREPADNFLCCRRAGAKSGLNRPHVDALPDPQESASPRQARQGLADRRSGAKMQQPVRAKRCSLGEFRRVLCNTVGQAEHVRIIPHYVRALIINLTQWTKQTLLNGQISMSVGLKDGRRGNQECNPYRCQAKDANHSSHSLPNTGQSLIERHPRHLEMPRDLTLCHVRIQQHRFGLAHLIGGHLARPAALATSRTGCGQSCAGPLPDQ